MQIIDRSTGSKFEEKIYGQKMLLFAYGRRGSLIGKILARVPLFSWLFGLWMRLPHTKRKIAPFVQKYGIKSSEWEKESFTSFDDFFTRRLKKGVRPVAKTAVVAPADGRYVVYHNFAEAKEILVKGEKFCLQQLLQEEQLAKKYAEAPVVIARLAPPDYHRFHAPVEGVLGQKRKMRGPLFSVNPVALKGRLAHLIKNKRIIVPIETTDLGTVLFIPVGATFVGSIHWTVPENARIEKGEELGYFSFGGSMIVLLFEKGSMILPNDLVENSKSGFETFMTFGQPLCQE